MSTLHAEILVPLGARRYPILVGEDILDDCEPLRELAAGRQVAIVTNATVAPLFEPRLRRLLSGAASALLTVALPDGESHKGWAALNQIFDALLAARFDRRCLIVALGGGVVGDMAGFAAATYQRGVEFVQVPTTLLAQVDSSVGGKTAINHPLGKNMIGAFHQPRLVLADVAVLRSLPVREVSAGLAEMIKHGAIADPAYLGRLEADMAGLLRCEPTVMAAAVARSCEIKAEVVAADEREADRRATLNFGHTFGHAIEAGLGFGTWLHGEAVGTGMLMAAGLSRRLGMLDQAACERLRSTVAAAGLPEVPPQWPAERWLELMSVDKKSEQGTPKFVLLDGLGRAVVRKVPEGPLRETCEAGA